MDQQKDQRAVQQLLLDYLKAYQAWLDKGAPETQGEVFSRHCGLCLNSWYYIIRVLKLKGDEADEAEEQLDDLLKALFMKDELCTEIPFNREGLLYQTERENRITHLNSKRRAWVKKTIEELST